MFINEIKIIENIQKLKLINLMKYISEPFDGINFIVIVLFFYIYKVIDINDVIFISSGSIVSAIIKLIFKRKRPFRENKSVKNFSGKEYQNMFEKYSFPSGHTFAATIFAIIMYMKYPDKFIFHLIPVIVGFSRIFLGVHYLTDIIGGIVIAFIYYHLFSSDTIIKN